MRHKKTAPTTSHISPWLYWGLWPIHRLFLPLYFSRITIVGREQLPKEGHFLLAPKHCSRWDPVILPLVWPYPLRFMTNAIEFGGVQGWFIRRLGAFAVDLRHPQPSSLRHVLEILNAGQPLVIFPEGGIVPDQVVRPLKPGLARLVLQADRPLPIFPVGIAYDPQPQFRARVALWIGAPLWTPAEREGNLKQQAQELTQQLEAALHAAVLEARKWARSQGE
ncbi:lysophospholipid acyltransferase family protein [Thermosynechococcus sp. JY1334]|uniref:lysophospholipid acyltransferase family protein n=1 Tax=unclassified Thermosynechococcus TaxID=2622553 RepID=UPI002673E843|nr:MULTISPECIES: lysophospholipid acyltransferase family protein [unclassified Thermosynechococcus]MDR7899149.1 lysophospholipid acyltransferase family protein [Thermosynechococcus sp. JY1332]MDR7906556.1 lysophospholipid acyltransferase family protein [Thermosynechococcus sp. JY1334]MDR7994378.1 lysophospholipid acyltransferase family protein [Thermosynechococcus sp. TG252]WKT86269.1 lysophospholipid acyltransferase family protein [Thermosynechococcus sp. JY1339]WNC55215.1 lysophospholipid ac